MKTLLGVVLLLLVGAGAWWVWSHPPNYAPVADTGQHVLMGSTTPDGNYVYASSTATYEISAKYPARTLLQDDAADQKARLAIETALKDEIDTFLQNVAGLDATVLPSLADGHKLAFDADYKTYAATGTVSYLYTIYQDTGGAHPNGFFMTFVFDRQGNQLTLADLFKPGADYLTPLAKAATAAVTEKLRTALGTKDVSGALFADGLAPKDENFQNWVLDDGTLYIVIPPYQAAAYAAGSFEARIPLADLKDILK